MTNDAEVVGHLGDCFEATYRSLGESAPLLENDAFVVVTHEMGRSFGEVTLALREFASRPLVALPVIGTLLARSRALDPSGSLLLYAVAMVVGPRLLVSLRDALEVLSDPSARALVDEAQLVTVRQVRRIGDLASAPGLDEASWYAGIAELGEIVDFGHYAESFGVLH